ncbi:uncharacterized protein PV06_06262 [Exophiala oligosperma]|uniref:Uncharacterized protein n=1 Tax=Exophiala oligosperma TaxID=215243 RepID=A0A0D2AS69_9EURO|nr:uncharacterized protein PV06_06262 [Exophiala oligosperma]KIW42746.1 hypothetical protein PV06_06262 [Exophiala oligosperma]
MGLKRKASVLEDSLYQVQEQQQQQQLSSPVAPSLTYSSPASTNTISPVRDSLRGDDNAAPYNFWKIEAVPYLSSRTRKRYRDNRPEEEIVHENTLRKLYDAQRLHLDDALPISEVVNLDGQGDIQVEEEDDVDMTDGTDNPGLPRSPQRNQRTLESFFCGVQSIVTPRNHDVHRPSNDASFLQPKQQQQHHQSQPQPQPQQQNIFTMWSTQGHHFQSTVLMG